MGVDFYNKAGENVHMSYGSFFEVRKYIAHLINPSLGDWYSAISFGTTNEEIQNASVYFNHIYNIPKEVIDFLFMPDYEGRINGKIIKPLKIAIDRGCTIKEKPFAYDGFYNLLSSSYSKRMAINWC